MTTVWYSFTIDLLTLGVIQIIIFVLLLVSASALALAGIKNCDWSNKARIKLMLQLVTMLSNNASFKSLYPYVMMLLSLLMSPDSAAILIQCIIPALVSAPNSCFCSKLLSLLLAFYSHCCLTLSLMWFHWFCLLMRVRAIIETNKDTDYVISQLVIKLHSYAVVVSAICALEITIIHVRYVISCQLRIIIKIHVVFLL